MGLGSHWLWKLPTWGKEDSKWNLKKHLDRLPGKNLGKTDELESEKNEHTEYTQVYVTLAA